MEAQAKARIWPTSPERQAFLALGVVMACFAGITSCQSEPASETGSASRMKDRQAWTDSDRAKLEQNLGFTLPATAHVLWLKRQSGLDDMVRVKLEMSRAEFDAMFGKPPLSGRDLQTGSGRLGVDRGRWNPNSTPGVMSAQIPLTNARFLNIGVAESNGTITVFLMQHST